MSDLQAADYRWNNRKITVILVNSDSRSEGSSKAEDNNEFDNEDRFSGTEPL